MSNFPLYDANGIMWMTVFWGKNALCELLMGNTGLCERGRLWTSPS